MTLEQLLLRIGRRVAELRFEKKLTQEELAAALGVTPRYVQRLERGTENVSVGTIYKIARVLHADVTDFFAKPGPTRPPRVARRPTTGLPRGSPSTSPRKR